MANISDQTQKNVDVVLFRIRKRLKSSSITFHQASVAAGLNPQYLSKLFSGRINPTLSNIIEVCNTCEIEISEIFRDLNATGTLRSQPPTRTEQTLDKYVPPLPQISENLRDTFQNPFGYLRSMEPTILAPTTVKPNLAEYSTFAPDPVKTSPSAIPSNCIEVLTLMAKGMRDREISEALGIKIETIRARRNVAYSKSGTKTQAQLMVHAAKAGWV